MMSLWGSRVTVAVQMPDDDVEHRVENREWCKEHQVCVRKACRRRSAEDSNYCSKHQAAQRAYQAKWIKAHVVDMALPNLSIFPKKPVRPAMSTESRSDMAQWRTILDLSTRMLEQAETRDWQALEALMSARDRLLKLYFADGAAPGRVEMLKEQIAVIQANDRLIVELTQKNRELLAEELIKLQRARQQILQYQKGLQ